MRSSRASWPFIRTAALLLLPVAVLAIARSVKAANALIMESKWVESGGRDVKIGIYVSNDDSLAAVILPLEFRSIHVGSFITRALSIRATSRMAYLENPENAYTIQKLYFPRKRLPDDDAPWACPSDSSGMVWRWSDSDSLPDFVGEEAMMYAVLPIDFIPPGDDIASGEASPSLILEFDVTETGGAFVIDTTCTYPMNHLEFYSAAEYYDAGTAINPIFQRSIVLIGCNSECHGDPNCDGMCNIVDLVKSIAVAFKGASPVIDPDPRCPVENTDVNCDLVTNAVDIVKMINVQYRMASINSEFCAPCDHIPRTGNPKEDVRTPYFRNNGS